MFRYPFGRRTETYRTRNWGTGQFKLGTDLSNNDVDCSYTDETGHRYRINVYRQQGLPAIALRLLNNHIPTVDEMKLPPILKEISLLPRGLVLVTGPTGSGKSTTLAAMINHINTNKSEHILTLEDPIEYIHQSKQSMINQREIHKDVHDFIDTLSHHNNHTLKILFQD